MDINKPSPGSLKKINLQLKVIMISALRHMVQKSFYRYHFLQTLENAMKKPINMYIHLSGIQMQMMSFGEARHVYYWFYNARMSVSAVAIDVRTR